VRHPVCFIEALIGEAKGSDGKIIKRLIKSKIMKATTKKEKHIF